MKFPDPECHPRRSVVQPDKGALIKRLNRIEGQVRGLTKMVEGDRYCVDVLTQVSAIKSALNEVALRLLEDHTKGCVQGAIKNGEGEGALAELMEVARMFLRS